MGAAMAVVLLAMAALVGVYMAIVPTLPDIHGPDVFRLQEPLRIYSRDQILIGEFGNERRTPIAFDRMPPILIQAFLAAEDARFFEHSGVDVTGLARAAIHLLRTGRKEQGGSTITMQVARNFFLTNERTFKRKIKEIILAVELERSLSKQKLFELYLNKIYLGERSYGVASAAETYFGKKPHDLSLAEAALLAGLPKAPSRYNPMRNPSLALERRNYVLERMLALHYIDAAAYQQARTAPVTVGLRPSRVASLAEYAADMVRADVVAHYGEATAYTSGLKVYTTIDADLNRHARRDVLEAVLAYEHRHGYRGPLGQLNTGELQGGPDRLERILAEWPVVADVIVPAIIMQTNDQGWMLYARGYGSVTLPRAAWRWAGQMASNLRPGAVVQIMPAETETRSGHDPFDHSPPRDWVLAQTPQVQGALVALNPQNGAIESLVGGVDFEHSKFNRVTQAHRQAGSSLKPFIYSAALEEGITPATMFDDSPVVVHTSSGLWMPGNYGGSLHGRVSLREALRKSLNLVSIKVLQRIGVSKGRQYLQNFGFREEQLPDGLSLALGTADVTPLEMARAYAVLANGGYLVTPYLIDRIADAAGKTIYHRPETVLCDACLAGSDDTFTYAPRVVSAQNTFVMRDLLHDVTVRGTAAEVRKLGRQDVGGKTGTSTDFHDAWFAGFTPTKVAIAWLGFDQPKSLGAGETGGRAALPMWLAFMSHALRDIPDVPATPPPGVLMARIDPQTGLAASADNPAAVPELFLASHLPPGPGPAAEQPPPMEAVPRDLF
jgi:penicillin-binding protein 1A